MLNIIPLTIKNCGCALTVLFSFIRSFCSINTRSNIQSRNIFNHSINKLVQSFNHWILSNTTDDMIDTDNSYPCFQAFQRWYKLVTFVVFVWIHPNHIDVFNNWLLRQRTNGFSTLNQIACSIIDLFTLYSRNYVNQVACSVHRLERHKPKQQKQNNQQKHEKQQQH